MQLRRASDEVQRMLSEYLSYEELVAFSIDLNQKNGKLAQQISRDFLEITEVLAILLSKIEQGKDIKEDEVIALEAAMKAIQCCIRMYMEMMKLPKSEHQC